MANSASISGALSTGGGNSGTTCGLSGGMVTEFSASQSGFAISDNSSDTEEVIMLPASSSSSFSGSFFFLL